jgi:hypothetical protein
MTLKALATTLRNLSLVLGGLLLFQTAAFAGPPLICHPFKIGDATSLPFQGPGWNAVDPAYNTSQLVGDTLALLTPNTPVLVRMETIRRATVYARYDPKLSAMLLDRIKARADAMSAKDPAAALAWFDLGYLTETYRQAARAAQYGNAFWSFRLPNTGDLDGYALVERAIRNGGSPEMEFAAALIKGEHHDAGYEQHLQKAMQSAHPGSLLAQNLSAFFPEAEKSGKLAEARN